MEEARDMAYDETTYRRPDGQPADPAAYRTTGLSTDVRRHDGGDGDPGYEPLRRGFREVGTDRLGVHIGWEIVLLLAVAAIGYLLYRFDPASLRRPALDTLLISGTSIGLLTLGAGVTMRAGVPNLAVGPIALAAALQYAEQGDRGLAAAAVPAVLIAAAGGLVIGLLIIGLSVPAWAATLAGGMGAVVYSQLRVRPVTVQGDFDPSNRAFYLFGVFALIAVIGGAVDTMPPVRRLVGRMRTVSDPAERRGLGAALPVLASLVVSSAFAAIAGILMAAQSTKPIVPNTGLEWTGVAFGTALIAGTSVFGRRGGVFGTLLAVVGMTLFLDYADRRNFDIALFAIAACAIGGGLVVSRLVETYGRPLPPPGVADDWNAAPAGGTPNWSPDVPETWTPSIPTQNRWDEGPWGGSR
jgi:ribose/xylose/arabinose/galactoside ABC-type transport system permease subunit